MEKLGATPATANAAAAKRVLTSLYRLPVIPRCGRAKRQTYHVWGMDDAGIFLSQRAGGGRAAAFGTGRKRACVPAGSDDRRVDAVTSARLKERIVVGAALERDGVVAFRGVDAQRILKEEFDMDCSLSSTYRLLHRLKLSWLAPRPRHPEADATAQAAFSQHLDCS